IEVRLVSQYPTGGSALVANSTLTSSDSPGQTKLESPDLNIAIDNEEYAYLVETYWTPPATPADIQMYHVHIEFTVNTPRP
ncbi:MAG: hypothetical protein GY842_18905, partial [bacterium]|nr:hypothetical protein [bacterium]